jgi:biopolymer transport protein ExbD
MSSTQSNSGGLFRINVVPIIDVALTLVIILLLTAPMLAVPNLDLDLPEARTRGADEPESITITLDRNGQLAVDERVVASADFERLLQERLAEEAPEDPQSVRVVLRADAGLPYADVRSVLERARLAGAGRLAVATRQPGLAAPPQAVALEENP